MEQSKLFSDVMQITRKQGNNDDADGAITSTDSPIWLSCLTIALQELVKDLSPLSTEVTGSTTGTTVLGKPVQTIAKPTDLQAVKYLYFDNYILRRQAHSDIFEADREGYAVEGDVIYINSSSIGSYTMKYYKKWPKTSGVISTDLSILDDDYYMSLLWQTVKQLYLFYEDIDGANVASGIYDRLKDTIPGNAITPIMAIHSNRG